MARLPYDRCVDSIAAISGDHMDGIQALNLCAAYCFVVLHSVLYLFISGNEVEELSTEEEELSIPVQCQFHFIILVCI